MKSRILCSLVVMVMLSCNSKNNSGDFNIQGELKNAPDQEVFLEQLFFNQNPLKVVDTTEMKNGIFDLKATANEEGLYRIRFAQNAGYLFINDKKETSFEANANDSTLHTSKINSPANASLTNLILKLDSIHTRLMGLDQQHKSLLQEGNDSLALQVSADFALSNEAYKKYLIAYMDTTKSPIVALFAMSYAQEINMDTLRNKLTGLAKRWPENSSPSIALRTGLRPGRTGVVLSAPKTNSSASVGSGLPGGTAKRWMER